VLCPGKSQEASPFGLSFIKELDIRLAPVAHA
jgi:hypothetical protein